jgi:hypothetical protein
MASSTSTTYSPSLLGSTGAAPARRPGWSFSWVRAALEVFAEARDLQRDMLRRHPFIAG